MSKSVRQTKSCHKEKNDAENTDKGLPTVLNIAHVANMFVKQSFVPSDETYPSSKEEIGKSWTFPMSNLIRILPNYWSCKSRWKCIIP